MRELKALYFPYSHYVNLTTLKKLILLFDQLVFVNTPRATEDPTFTDLDTETLEHTQLLREAGYIRNYYYTPEQQFSQEFIQALMAQDRSDPSFVSVGTSIERRHWIQATNPELLEDKKTTLVYGVGQRMMVLRSASDDDSIHLERVGKVPVGVGVASMVITQALAISDEQKLALVTESSEFAGLVRSRYQRAVENVRNLYCELKPEYGTADLSKLSTLGISIIERMIPDEAFENRSLSEILRYRQENEGNLERFKSRLFELLHELEEELWSPDLNRRVLRIVDRSIVPESQRLQDEMTRSYEKMFGAMAGKVAAAVSPTVLATIYAGLTSGEILVFACAAASGAVSISLPELIDVWKARRNWNRNALAYLAGFRQ